ncbi:MAG: cytochrome c peroxidase [Pseudomonadota bacterium]
MTVLRCALLALFLTTGCSDGRDSFSPATGPSAPTPEPEPAPEPEPDPPRQVFETPEALGERLFFDTNLSLNRTQACATCHDPERGFTDGRLNAFGEVGAFSVGDDGFSEGGRNAPSAGYAAFTPGFQTGTLPRFNSQQSDYVGFFGGQFWDGRASELSDQAMGPPLAPGEMGMPDTAAVMERLLENPDYAASFPLLYGEDIFDNADAAFIAMADAIGAYERTEVFSPFTSKYDRSLHGEYVYIPGTPAALGRALFFSQQFTNCATCHQLHPNSNRREPFTRHEYHNVGVPINEAARLAANIPLDAPDEGLLNNPLVNDPAQRGKFKVPTLRNVAVTGPYMHNGVFRRLDTVIRFYDQFLAGSSNAINPETGDHWREGPFPETLASEELRDGRTLDDFEIDALVCFLRTLTDARYEHLIEDDGLICD